jgi:hypothetical protein
MGLFGIRFARHFLDDWLRVDITILARNSGQIFVEDRLVITTLARIATLSRLWPRALARIATNQAESGHHDSGQGLVRMGIDRVGPTRNALARIKKKGLISMLNRSLQGGE